ncbi:deoxyribodipyrimidine photolyase [alpha proteobacterium AAP81b]|nr:deoxyribodipyrimidine photolyase [alpha proteobacterium AAP81b]
MSSHPPTPQLVWLRNDLRLADHRALSVAAHLGPVALLYVFDEETPGAWAMGAAQRWWLHHSLAALAREVAARGGRLLLRRGRAAAMVAEVARELDAGGVHALRHYEPWARVQDAEVALAVDLQLHDGALLTRPEAVTQTSGERYRIFTPWWKRAQAQLPPEPPRAVPELTFADGGSSDDLDSWRLLPRALDWSAGFSVWTPGEAGARERLASFLAVARGYGEARNLPSEDGSSRLSPHLALGEISVASVWHAIADAIPPALAEPYLRELGWRDFAANLLDLFPDSPDAPGRREFRLVHRDAPGDLAAWQRGRTGYPIVDAGMRQLWRIGWMHNRVRMIAASFLVKHLLIDWRQGERWFWDCLVDADLGANAMGWQWVMGSGVDSSPFHRVFAPVTQSEKFRAAAYIRQWVPELARLGDDDIHAPFEASPLALAAAGVRLGQTYPLPIVGHAEGRARALAAYAAMKG